MFPKHLGRKVAPFLKKKPDTLISMSTYLYWSLTESMVNISPIEFDLLAPKIGYQKILIYWKHL